MSPENQTAKDEIRARHRKLRTGLPADARSDAADGIAAHGLAWAEMVADGRPATFTAYLGVAFEPPTLRLITALHEAGHSVLLPVCEPDRALSWVFWNPATEFVRSKYAPIQEPAGERHGLEVIKEVAAMFLPATAVDLSGNRIGQGGGYFDKFLEAADAAGLHAPRAAVIYDAELLPASTIPAESFDRPVDAVLTPSGIVPLA
ncbi:5-formyltetrahydrofolate cyclo-ligase [Arthrobacter sp. Soil736]|uniref:5-formyltetrahydrofolate cyclo-ligase n=1 Tax=Arthrobacter sp. Soil736 TaxID=1736395 RepID=UPI0007009FD6|nr:5-formyltetrahydrofolate cyclo-ligase [Arthrobacter sp. Soil736]KRE44656.1 5-formyltetrahydrofolate cyclo-ligase [Arthrobacter sp. Soil736]